MQLWKDDAEPIVELETDTPVDGDRFARFVKWIPWDSGFRGSGLCVGDLIVGHADLPYGPDAVVARTRIGDSRFSDWLREHRCKPGDALTLSVLRDDVVVQVEGRIGGPRRYVDSASRRTLGDGGPQATAKDDFDSAWESWYSGFVDLAKVALGGWDFYASVNSRNLAADIAALAPRVGFLQRQYPGDFSREVAGDFAKMSQRAAGERRELTAADLSYRELGAIRAAAVTQAADAAFTAFETEARLYAEPPASPNSFTEDIRPLIGAVVRLPALSRRNVLYETGRSWYWSGSDGGGYLIDRAAPSFEPLHVATREYTEIVDPSLRDSSIVFIGAVQAEPALVCDVDRNIVVTGVRLQPLAALVTSDTDATRRFFVDLRDQAHAGRSNEVFAGFDALAASIRRPALQDTATPAEVLQGAFDALAQGDMDTWLRCYATWSVTTWYERDGSWQWVDQTRLVMGEMTGASDWDRARKRLHADVYGLEVARVGAVRVVYDAAAQAALAPDDARVASGPRIVEEVTAHVNHIGLFDGEYRTFSGPLLHRRWTLQRLDGGPWRIAVAHSI